MKLWVAASAEDPRVSDKRRREMVLDQMNTRSAFVIADKIAGGPVGASVTGKASTDAARDVGLEIDVFSKGGPMNKMAKAAARASSLVEIQRFEAMTGRANVMKNCELSQQAVASGIRC